MEVKIDTKEKFSVLTPLLPELTVNIAAVLEELCLKQLDQPVKNVVLQMSQVQNLEAAAATKLAELQHLFYENSSSFVICSVNKNVETQFESLELMDFLNITPTESEAWDIVQMEEIERELLDGDDMEFEKND
ncbi:MAG: anti-anti-sigma factor [Bacteroidetes bacterium 24-39-8]|jgi:anti-anti-sigma factor|nr:MAG: anti-anti-sigma factor [Sphingobacteriia bacterium 35-40-8]OYZ47578.1 MAG: anti-anti-sigma factor [Bacteroidetes bacterium 24-39-8]OZA62861.1 MAG: anti-anti-sigma factor [Sphingobacteriia bacterium 39-39-8]HQR91806.1 STAS domain-containing protein [Sediminibacterium sp.]HQS56427.1 STAS domain-containing protein [Sediminibacterium sp.]